MIEEKVETRLVGRVEVRELRAAVAKHLVGAFPHVDKCEEYSDGIYLSLANGQKFDLQVHPYGEFPKALEQVKQHAASIATILGRWDAPYSPARCAGCGYSLNDRTRLHKGEELEGGTVVECCLVKDVTHPPAERPEAGA